MILGRSHLQEGPHGRHAHCPGSVGFLSWMDIYLWHSFSSSQCHFSPKTYLVCSLWLCNNRCPIPKGGTASTVLAVGDDSGIVWTFYPHALHLPSGSHLRTFICGQMHGKQIWEHAHIGNMLLANFAPVSWLPGLEVETECWELTPQGRSAQVLPGNVEQ